MWDNMSLFIFFLKESIARITDRLYAHVILKANLVWGGTKKKQTQNYFVPTYLRYLHS